MEVTKNMFEGLQIARKPTFCLERQTETTWTSGEVSFRDPSYRVLQLVTTRHTRYSYTSRQLRCKSLRVSMCIGAAVKCKVRLRARLSGGTPDSRSQNGETLGFDPSQFLFKRDPVQREALEISRPGDSSFAIYHHTKKARLVLAVMFIDSVAV